MMIGLMMRRGIEKGFMVWKGGIGKGFVMVRSWCMVSWKMMRGTNKSMWWSETMELRSVDLPKKS